MTSAFAFGEATPVSVLPYAIAIVLVAGLAVSVVARRPPRRLWPVLFLYQLFALLYLIGDTITRFSNVMWAEQVGIAVLYSGCIPAAAACWVLALRYAEVQGHPFPWASPAWVRVPVALSALAWGVMITNPLHGQFLTPVIGDHNLHHWAWWLLAPIGYVQVVGSCGLYALLGWSAQDPAVRRNAMLMAGGVLITVIFNGFSYLNTPPYPTGLGLPFDPTVLGLGAASALFLYGAYRTQLFSLLPAAVIEATRHDPSGLVLVDLEGGWLRSNPAACKLLGPSLKRPGRDVIALLAHRFQEVEGGPLSRDDLARRLLQGPRASQEVVGPLRGGDGHWVEITATPIPRSEGRARAVSLRVQDVSERVAVEEQLRRARRELEIECAERREVDALLGEVLCALSRAKCSDDPGRVRGLAQRALRAAEQARGLTGAVPRH